MRTTLCWLTLLCSAAPLCASSQAAVDSGWILQKLARPAPTRTSFVEVRASPLLKSPLRLSGEYQRPRDDTLVRAVRTPYVETTTIVTGAGAGEVEIARAGKAPRRFSLSRVPELAGLQASFGALLAGDRARLEQFYRVAANGTRERWTLTLKPKDAQLAAQVRDITLYGRGAELRCIETRPVRGEAQRTLLATAARAADAVKDAAVLVTLCRSASDTN